MGKGISRDITEENVREINFKRMNPQVFKMDHYQCFYSYHHQHLLLTGHNQFQ